MCVRAVIIVGFITCRTSFFADFSGTTYLMYMGGLVLQNIAFPETIAAIVMSVQLKLKEHEIKVDF